MNAAAVLNRRIDPSAPLADASALLMAATTAARAPLVPQAPTRHARRFRRAEPSAQGATTMFRRRLSPTFSTAKAPVMKRSNLRMASAMLMAGTPAETGRISRLSPRVSVLSMTEMRAQVRALRAQRRKATMLVGTLKARFGANAADWGMDHRLDTPRMTTAQARYAAAQGPVPRFDY